MHRILIGADPMKQIESPGANIIPMYRDFIAQETTKKARAASLAHLSLDKMTTISQTIFQMHFRE